MDSGAPEMYIVYISLPSYVFSGCITKLFPTLISVFDALSALYQAPHLIRLLFFYPSFTSLVKHVFYSYIRLLRCNLNKI